MVDPSNAYFSTAAGIVIAMRRCEKPHSRKARKLELVEKRLREVLMQIPMVKESDVPDYAKILSVTENEFARIADEAKMPQDITLINLVCFCVDCLPDSKKLNAALRQLLDCYPDAYSYIATRTGHRMFLRFTTEIEIFNA